MNKRIKKKKAKQRAARRYGHATFVYYDEMKDFSEEDLRRLFRDFLERSGKENIIKSYCSSP